MATTPVGPAIYQITVNGIPQTDFPLDIELHQEWGAHDVFMVRIEYNRGFPMSRIIPWAENAPVEIIWGRRPDSLNTWYGYVNHYEMASNADSGTHNLQIKYWLIGMSKPMNSDTGVVWGNVTPTYIAKTIAAKHRLRTVVTSTTWLLSSEVQAAESDFEFMNRIADKTGYRFWVSNGTLYFIDPAVVLQGSSQQGVPMFTQNKLLDQQDTMRDFCLLKGDNIPGSASTVRSVFGIDSTTGQVFRATTDNPPSGATIEQWNTKRVANSYSEGKQIANAWQSLSQFFIAASAELFGNTLLYPGKLVLLTGSALPDDNLGYWMVAKATHVLKKSGTTYSVADKYVTQCTLVRNINGQLPTLKGNSVISPEFVTCSLSNGAWVSNNIGVIVDGVRK